MNQGKYVFSQVMTYFPRWVFEVAVEKYNGDFHAKNLNSYSHCLHLMFGQMAGCKSLKDIALVLRSIKKAAYHLGIPTVVDPSSLSKANEVRDYRIFEELGMWLIRKVRPMYAKKDIPDVHLPGWEIFAIDSTTIPCSIKLAEWALGIKLELIRHGTPMQAGVLPLAVLSHSIWMSCRVHISSVLVKRYPINAVRFCESCHIYCITYTNV